MLESYIFKDISEKFLPKTNSSTCEDVFYLRLICTCDQFDSPLCPLQLTVLIKASWYVLLSCCACFYPNLILVQGGWTTIPCPTTNLSVFICISSERIKQSVVSVALKTPLRNKIENLQPIYKTSILHRPDDYIGFRPSCSPTFYNRSAPISNTEHFR